jgi:membrane associated rhomboid family serine protease
MGEDIFDRQIERVYTLGVSWCRVTYPPVHTAFLLILCMTVFFTDSNVYVRTPVDPGDSFYIYYASGVSHHNLLHLLSNVTSLVAFGLLLEVIHGTFASVMVFWISATTGALADAYLNKDTLYTGASPGVYGFIGAYFSHLLLNWNEAPLRYLWLFLLLMFAVENVIFYNIDEEFRNTIAHISHLFGFLQGVCIGLITIRNMKVAVWELWLQFIATLGSTGLILYPTIGEMFKPR